MEIQKINIDGFGKFHKYNAQTTDKIQVFYGKNEAGKTTIRKFMISMLLVWKKQEELLLKMTISQDICR